jgi:hypothetical protein
LNDSIAKIPSFKSTTNWYIRFWQY